MTNIGPAPNANSPALVSLRARDGALFPSRVRRLGASLSAAARLPRALRLFALCLLLSRPASWGADLVPHPDLGVRLLRGFQISLYSDSHLADDIQAMTLDALGRVVVSGPGYLRTLIDTNLDGRADQFVQFGHTKTGAMGMCFDGPYLYSVEDEGLWRWTDADWNGAADAAPVQLMALRGGEHGSHALRHGPDGAWLLMAGNDAEIHAGRVTDPRSPVRQPEAGTLLRFPADFSTLGVYAHGFRNAYDFDFNQLGDLFTYDSDVEREFLLPWYTPTRLYHIEFGGHHGWRMPGFLRSYARPEFYPDTVPMLRALGRGSPTGVAVYRHFQFPPSFQNGLFCLDWTFGRIWFGALEPHSTSYATEPIPFLEPMGNAGFAPTDLAVAPDGSLLVSIGGRKTRGGVYRITYPQDPHRLLAISNWVQQASTPVDVVLGAPQPLEAWSRALWRPRAAALGTRPFDLAVLAEGLPDSQRIRAIEVLTEIHGGLMTETAQLATNSRSPFVRGRVAWSLGRIPCKDFGPILLTLSKDANPRVRLAALEAIAEQVENLPSSLVAQAALANADHADKRLRQRAARLAQFLPLENWQAYYLSLMRSNPQARLGAALAVSWRFATNTFNTPLFTATQNALKGVRAVPDQIQGLALLVTAMGDWRIFSPTLELYSAYELNHPPLPNSPPERQILELIRPMLKSPDRLLSSEAARVLGMLRDPDPALPSQLLDVIKPDSDPARDMHHLIILSRLPARAFTNASLRTAAAVVGLTRKLQGLDQRPKQTWTDRFKELMEQLVRRDSGLADALLRYPGFVASANLAAVDAFDFPDRERAARLFLQTAKANPAFPWSPALVRLLTLLPARDIRPLLSSQWDRVELRDSLLLALAREPDPLDRDKFIAGLSSVQTEVIGVSADALAKLPPMPSPVALEAALKWLDRATQDSRQTSLVPALVKLVNRLTGQSFKIPDLGGDAAALRRATQPLLNWCAVNYPAVAVAAQGHKASATGWAELLRSVLWDRGDATLGEVTFRARSCANCHGGGTQLGPELSGVAKRLSPQDLFDHIKFPNKDVAEPYRLTWVKTKQGLTYQGLLAFVSADGILLRLIDGTTLRLPESEIASRGTTAESLMPEGLLDGLSPADLAHLYAYLKRLE